MLGVDDVNLLLAKEPGKPRGRDRMKVSGYPQRKDADMPSFGFFLHAAVPRAGKPHAVTALDKLAGNFKGLYFQAPPGMRKAALENIERGTGHVA